MRTRCELVAAGETYRLVKVIEVLDPKFLGLVPPPRVRYVAEIADGVDAMGAPRWFPMSWHAPDGSDRRPDFVTWLAETLEEARK